MGEKTGTADKVESNATVEETVDGRVILEKSEDGKVLRKIQIAPTNKKTPSEKQDDYVRSLGADNVSPELAKARAEIEHLRAQLKKAEYQLAMLQAHAGVKDFQVDKKNWSNGKADGKDGVQSGTAKPSPTVTLRLSKQSASDDDRDARLQKLEENLSVLLKEVKSLRDERDRDGRPTEKRAEKMAEKMKSKPQPKDDQGDSGVRK